MKTNDEALLKIKYNVLRTVSRLAFEGRLEEERDNIPFKLIPGPKAQFRCCVYKEREIIRQRIRLVEGKCPSDKQSDNIIQVISSACEECPITRFVVTDNCQKCMGKACQNACNFGAISIGRDRAHIDPSVCKECGRCAQACPYNAIAELIRPCRRACPVDAITMDPETGICQIDGKEVYAVDDNRFGSFNTGVGQDELLKTDQNSAHLKYFNACISYDGDYDLSNKTVEITLKNLTEEGDYDTTVITDGTWDFKWTLGAVKPPTTLEVNRKCDFGGYEITVKKMEVTPLLWSLYLDYDEAMKVYEDEKNKFEYTGTDYGMDLYGRANIDQVRYKDGTVLTLDLTMGGIAGGGEKQDKENGVMIIRNSFPQLVDVDNLQAVHFGNIDQWLEVRE